MSSEAWIRAQRLALLEHAAVSLRKNRIEAEVVPNAQRLLERLEQLVPQTASASSGGSVTLEQTGVLNWLRTSGRSYYAGDPHAPDCGTREQIQFCDYYFMSANAITRFGVGLRPGACCRDCRRKQDCPRSGRCRAARQADCRALQRGAAAHKYRLRKDRLLRELQNRHAHVLPDAHHCISARARPHPRLSAAGHLRLLNAPET